MTIHAPPAEAIDELVAELVAIGGGAVEQAADHLTTYLPPPDDVRRFEEETTARLSALVPGQSLELSWRWQEHEDWGATWRRGLGPRRVGERIVVTPSWSEPELRAGDLVIVVDPEMAFGTGEHATTRGALRALETAVREGDRVLDVGTGSAILAIAAARLGASEVLAVESDADAIENASDNIRRNGVADRVELLHGLVDDPFLALFGPGHFDVIVANVLSGVLIPLLPAFHTSLTPEGTGAPGRLILGGILEEEGEMMIDAAERAGFKLLVEDLEDEWWGGLFEARRA